MTTPEARREALREALLTGTVLRNRLAKTLTDVTDAGLLLSERIAAADETQLRLTDSLVLVFANLAALVQDQVFRLVLATEDFGVGGVTRRDQRLRAEAIGLVSADRHFDGIAELRNRVAHSYPRDPARQQQLLREIAKQSEAAIGAFDDGLRYALDRYFGGTLLRDGGADDAT